MTIAQQARDAAAIIKAIGNDKATIFGSSGGGIISLELALFLYNCLRKNFIVVIES